MTSAVQESQSATQAWIPNDETFGARLALIRQKMGWGNVAEAALACGLPANSWRNWERDNRNPRNIVEIAEAVSNRTGADFDWLLRGQRVPGRAGRQSTGESLVVAGQPRSKRRGQVTTQPSGPLTRVAPSPGFPRTVRIPRSRAHIAA